MIVVLHFVGFIAKKDSRVIKTRQILCFAIDLTHGYLFYVICIWYIYKCSDWYPTFLTLKLEAPIELALLLFDQNRC